MDFALTLGAFALLIVLLDAIGRWQRSVDSAEGDRVRAEVRLAEDRGSHTPIAQHPIIDVQKCIGCASCVRACPESGVLGIVDGVARIIHGSRCIGHARCQEVCPVQAIVVGLGDVSTRDDLPILDADYGTSVPGIRIAGELGGMALIRIAVDQAVRAMRTFATELRGSTPPDRETFDVVIVGAGPAGFAATLQAKKEGLRVATIDRQDFGGTIRQYPRRKLTLTGELTLPLHGTLEKREYPKEELLDLWTSIARRHGLRVSTGLTMTGVTGSADAFVVRTDRGAIRARRVLLALGRRGIPRRLGVPGEELEKVLYQLLDAQSVRDERILVVGGGDSAIEAAIALAEQRGNTVTISYRRDAFFRLKARNEDRLRSAITAGRIRVVHRSTVARIDAERVVLRVESDTGAHDLTVENDTVYVLAGGEAPVALLRSMGVAFGGTGAQAPVAPNTPLPTPVGSEN